MTVFRALRRSFLVVSAIVLLATLAACSASSGSSSSGATSATGGTTLRVDDATAPASLDPAGVCSIEDLGLLSDLYPTLTQYAVEPGSASDAQQVNPAAVKPDLATSWTVSPDGKTYTFHLRQGAKFASGDPITAQVVKWSWQRAIALGSCGVSFVNGSNTGKVLSIQTPNEYTVVTTLSAVDPDYLLALTSAGAAIVDEKVVQQHGSTAAAQNTWLASHYAGGGPYKVTSYVSGTSLDLTANPDWYGTKPLEKNVSVSFISDDSTLLLRAKEGLADVTLGLSKQSVASLKTNSKVKIIDNKAAAWEVIGLPNEVAPFNNVTFREALTYATPQQQIVQKVAYGYGQAFYGPLSPAFPAYDAAASPLRPYSLTKAKQLLAQSGVKTPVSIDLYTRDGVTDEQQIAEIVQSAWQQLGVNLKIVQLSAAAYQSAVSAPVKKWAILRFDGPSVLTPEWLLSYDAECGSAFNQSNYCNPKLDSLLAQAETTASASARQSLYDQITQIWVADSPRVVIYAQNYDAVLQKDVTNYVYAQNNTLFSLWGK